VRGETAAFRDEAGRRLGRAEKRTLRVHPHREADRARRNLKGG